MLLCQISYQDIVIGMYTPEQLMTYTTCQPIIIMSCPFLSVQRKHQAMYDDFVKRKDMKREGYSSGSLHTFTTNGGNSRYSLPISTGVAAGGGGFAGIGSPEGGVGGGSGGAVTKFDRHDPRQVWLPVLSFMESQMTEVLQRKRCNGVLCLCRF